MVMTPYTRSQYDSQTHKWRDGSITYVGNQLARQQRLYSVSSTVGDYFTPNPHRYERYAFTTLTGYERTVYANGETQSVTGPNIRNHNIAIHFPKSFDENVRAMALSDLYQTLRDSDIDLSVDGVQWRQTLAMLAVWKRGLRSIASEMLYVLPVGRKTQRALDRLNKGNLARDVAARLTREVDGGLNWLANRRLEYVYGWKPTLNTIYDLAKLATTPNSRGFVTVYGYGYLKGDTILYQHHLGNNIPIVNEITKMERCRIVCQFSPANDTLEKLGAISSLNPVSLIYEATPYSFVLDWAVGFGDWFRSMETALMHQNNFLRGYQTRSIRWIDKARRSGKSSTTLPYFETELRADVQYTRFERTRLSSAPFPTRPVIKVRFGLDQALNAAALSKQKVSFIDNLLKVRK